MSDSQYVEALVAEFATIETRSERVLVDEVKRLRTRLDDLSSFCDKSVEKMTAKIDALKARLAWFERRQVFFDKLTSTVEANPSNPSYLHAILEGLRLWDSENPKPSEGNVKLAKCTQCGCEVEVGDNDPAEGICFECYSRPLEEIDRQTLRDLQRAQLPNDEEGT